MNYNIDLQIPRPEYPRPQFVRNDWLNLNGQWQFEIDCADTGLDRGLLERELKSEITVPFCPESKSSGIEHTDFMLAVWYRRKINIPNEWRGQQILLHFQACDHDTTVWVNGEEIARHRGGFTPFTADITNVAAPGENATIVVRARDDWRKNQPRGKQSQQYNNHGCFYTRTTGIWQTVWLEPVPPIALKRPKITPDVANSILRLEQPISAGGPGPHVEGLQLKATLLNSEGIVAQETCSIVDFTPALNLTIPKEKRRLWSPKDPHLYDIEIELLDSAGNTIDSAKSYTGLRSITLDGKAVKINGEIIFQRLVLDQGYYKDGILTAPSDDDLKRDITLSMEAGFNGARLHEKVFEERFLYHADKLGYLVWGEFADWDSQNGTGPSGNWGLHVTTYITQWLEVLQRDYNHPSIIGWCGLNETCQKLEDKMTTLDDCMHGIFLAAKAMDQTRPVLDSSGYAHRVVESDISDCHDYQQDAKKLKSNQAGLAEAKPYENFVDGKFKQNITYRGQPFFVSEFGGIRWNPAERESSGSWGYGDAPKTEEEFYQRFEELCKVLLDNPDMFGYCYTQLTDVFQEQNGIYYFDRSTKVDIQRLRQAQQRVAAIEKDNFTANIQVN